MTDLCAAFEAAGCRNVRSYIQSGNVVFDAPDASLLPALRDAVTGLTSLSGNVFFRTTEELRAAIEQHPFGDRTANRKLKLYVVFLATAPRPISLPFVDEKEKLELVGLREREAYVVSAPKPSRMYGFPSIFIEKHLGVPCTVRSWNTVTKLVALTSKP
jgi:uncharacterized protein (DUF1697 family)